MKFFHKKLRMVPASYGANLTGDLFHEENNC